MRSIIGLFGVASLVSGWWDGGHVLSGEIAVRQLVSLGRMDVIEVINKALYAGADLWPCHAGLQSSTTWLDYAKQSHMVGDRRDPAKPDLGYEFTLNLKMWNKIHYYDALYVDPKGVEAMGWKGEDEGRTTGAPWTLDDPTATFPTMTDRVTEPDPTGTGTDWEDRPVWWEDTLNSLEKHHLKNATLNTILHTLSATEGALWSQKSFEKNDKTAWSFGLLIHHLTHLLGDLHMPCHTAALWNYEDHLKTGEGLHDEGANYIKIQYQDADTCPNCVTEKIGDLHAFWDAMGGWETRNRFDIWGGTGPHVQEIMEEFPVTDLKKLYPIEEATILDIMKESFSLAAVPQDIYNGYHVYKGVYFHEHFCYTPNCNKVTPSITPCVSEYCCVACDVCVNPPNETDPTNCEGYGPSPKRFMITPEYVDFAVKASKERIALTGYRLAYRLVQAVDNITPELRNRINQAFKAAASRQQHIYVESGCVSLRSTTDGAELNVFLSIPIVLGALLAILN